MRLFGEEVRRDDFFFDLYFFPVLYDAFAVLTVNLAVLPPAIGLIQ